MQCEDHIKHIKQYHENKNGPFDVPKVFKKILGGVFSPLLLQVLRRVDEEKEEEKKMCLMSDASA